MFWIQKIFGIGYISKRNDGITELRINGFKQIERIIKLSLPFIKFKKTQAKVLYKASLLLQNKNLQRKDYEKLIDMAVNE